MPIVSIPHRKCQEHYHLTATGDIRFRSGKSFECKTLRVSLIEPVAW